MIHLLNRDHDFYLQKYKTVWCPDTQTHDRSVCVYAHNIQDFRRNPFKYNYEVIIILLSPKNANFGTLKINLKHYKTQVAKQVWIVINVTVG